MLSSGFTNSSSHYMVKVHTVTKASLFHTPHLTLQCPLVFSPDTANAAAGVPAAWGLPGPLSSGAVVVEMPATQVFVRLPVTQNVQRWAGGDGWQTGLWDLQLLQVGVDRRVGPALTCGRCCLEEGGHRMSFSDVHLLWFPADSSEI